MKEDRENGTSLQQRVNSYLREEQPGDGVFAAPVQAAEAELKEYLLQRAETELRATQARIEALRQELARIR
jgi:hypothetical protein